MFQPPTAQCFDISSVSSPTPSPRRKAAPTPSPLGSPRSLHPRWTTSLTSPFKKRGTFGESCTPTLERENDSVYQIAKVAEVIKAGTPVKGTIKRKPSRFVIDEVEGEGDGSKQTAFEFLLKEERRKGKAQIPKQSVFTEELPLSTTSSEGSPVKALSNKKWFRCDIFPASSHDFSDTIAECKQLVLENQGAVLEDWTYPGGFMFQLPHLTASPFDNWEPTLLGGHVRITQFQPFLEPVQHYIGTGSPSSKSPSSKSPSSKLFDGTSKKGMEEIPLLCVSPSKPQRSWNPDSPGPEVRSRMQSFIEGQKKKREGVQYELCAGGMLAGGKLYHELSADAEIKLVQEKKTKKNADDEWESDAGSEFSVATGLDSVKFLADCGSFF